MRPPFPVSPKITWTALVLYPLLAVAAVVVLQATIPPDFPLAPLAIVAGVLVLAWMFAFTDRLAVSFARADVAAAWNEAHFSSWATRSIGMCRDGHATPDDLADGWRRLMAMRRMIQAIFLLIALGAVVVLFAGEGSRGWLLGAGLWAGSLPAVAWSFLNRRRWEAVFDEWLSEARVILSRKPPKNPRPTPIPQPTPEPIAPPPPPPVVVAAETIAETPALPVSPPAAPISAPEPPPILVPVSTAVIEEKTPEPPPTPVMVETPEEPVLEKPKPGPRVFDEMDECPM